MNEPGWNNAIVGGVSPAACRSAPYRDVIIILLVTIAVRAMFLGNPHIDVDEQFYLLTGGRMLDGAVPFVDIWDRKPIGLFLIYAFANLFGNGVLAYELLALLCVGATAVVIHSMARVYADRWTALLAGVGYPILVNLLDGAGGQSPVFYNLLLAGAALIVQRQLLSRNLKSIPSLVGAGVLAMILCGLAIQVKYLVIGEGFFLGTVLLWIAFRRFGVFTALWAGLLWVAVALIPTGAAIAYYWAIGEIDAIMFANFHSIFLRPEDPIDWIFDRLLTIAMVLAAPVAVGLAGLRRSRNDRFTDDERLARRFVVGWAAFAWLAFLVFGTYFKHYALPLAAPTMLLFACASGRWLRLRALMLIIGALWGLRSAYVTSQSEVDTSTLNRIVTEMGDTRNCPFVFRGPSIIYHLGDFCLPTRYAFPYFLNHMRENPTLGIKPEEELRQVVARRPDYILVRWPMYDYSRVSLDILLPVLCSEYQPVLNELQWRGEALILYHLRPGGRPQPNDIGAGGRVGVAADAGARPSAAILGASRAAGMLPACPWHVAGSKGESVTPR